MNRKHFIKNLGFIFAGGIFTTTLFEGCTPVKYLSHTIKDSKVIVKKNEFKGNLFAIVSVANLPAPIYLRNTDEGKYIALLTKCMHKGCEVTPYYDRLSCPCHGSEYSYTGEVISPPAKDPLMKFNVTTDQDNIYIHINERQQ
jgi:Rieske Fe-S protein